MLFKEELNSDTGDIIVWINSPGGDCIAASQIYKMLMDYKGNVTVKIDGIAASAASVIAMAGTEVQISPTGLMMIHNPLTIDVQAYERTHEVESYIRDVQQQLVCFGHEYKIDFDKVLETPENYSDLINVLKTPENDVLRAYNKVKKYYEELIN